MPSSQESRTIRLNSGYDMPQIGLGMWRCPSDEAQRNVKTALEIGYRHFDTAYIYKNEADLGTILKSVPRSSVFITTKLWNTKMHPNDVEAACRASLEALGTDYIDLYLIHAPLPFKDTGANDGSYVMHSDGTAVVDRTIKLQDTWAAMESLVDKGLVRSIGISNFAIHHMQAIMKTARIPPAMNQVELHPYHPQNELVDFCKANNVAVTAYCPLGGGMQPSPIQDPEIVAIAEKLGKTPAQVILSWLLQRGIIAIPKSSNPVRLEQNFVTFKLSQEDFDTITAIGVGPKAQRLIKPKYVRPEDLLEITGA